MYSRDHNPPHFHAIHAESEALVEIASGILLAGSLPARAQRLAEQKEHAH